VSEVLQLQGSTCSCSINARAPRFPWRLQFITLDLD